MVSGMLQPDDVNNVVNAPNKLSDSAVAKAKDAFRNSLRDMRREVGDEKFVEIMKELMLSMADAIRAELKPGDPAYDMLDEIERERKASE